MTLHWANNLHVAKALLCDLSEMALLSHIPCPGSFTEHGQFVMTTALSSERPGLLSLVWALLRRKIRLKGPLKLLVAFGKCFPQ